MTRIEKDLMDLRSEMTQLLEEFRKLAREGNEGNLQLEHCRNTDLRQPTRPEEPDAIILNNNVK